MRLNTVTKAACGALLLNTVALAQSGDETNLAQQFAISGNAEG